MTKTKYDKDGFDKHGWNEPGINRITGIAYDKDGWSELGTNQETGTEFDENGFNKNGLNKDGYDKDGQKWQIIFPCGWPIVTPSSSLSLIKIGNKRSDSSSIYLPATINTRPLGVKF